MGPRVHLNVTTGSPSSLQVLNRWWFPLAHGRADPGPCEQSHTGDRVLLGRSEAIVDFL